MLLKCIACGQWGQPGLATDWSGPFSPVWCKVNRVLAIVQVGQSHKSILWLWSGLFVFPVGHCIHQSISTLNMSIMYINYVEKLQLDALLCLLWCVQRGCVGCSRAKSSAVTWCWCVGSAGRNAAPGAVWTRPGPTLVCLSMRSACWASWESCPANPAKVTTQ